MNLDHILVIFNMYDRRMTILGSLLATLGFLLSTAFSSMWPLYLTFG